MKEEKAVFEAYLAEHDLQKLLKVPYRCPFPDCTDREEWARVADEDRRAILEAASEAKKKPYPVLLATDYMAFARSGNRKVFEDPYFFRRKKLILSTLAYCLEEKDEDLDEVINGLWCIVEETSWVISAHNVDSHAGAPTAQEKPLPDVRSPMIDLFAAQTAMILSFVVYLTGAALDSVTPQVTRRVHLEIEKRILVPFETRDDFWWMGFLRKDLCNWTPWIVSNVLVTAALGIQDRLRLAGMVRRSLLMVDRWLAVVPEDGGCDEGVAYWNMAGGALMDILQLLSEMTEGRMLFSEEPKIRNILSFPRTMWLGGEWFANFADCDAKPYVCAERILYAGKYLKDPALMQFGQTLSGPVRQDLSDTPQMWRMLNRLFGHYDIPDGVTQPVSDSWLPDLQVCLVRKGKMTVCGKGGHNGESHNHNDVGSFVVFLDGNPVAVDIGNMTYTAKTFSSRRYELFNTRSRNHSVPQIGDWEQCVGPEHGATEVEARKNGMTMDLSHAYPVEAGALSVRRSWTVSDEGMFGLEDEVAIKEKVPVTFVLMLREKPEIQGNQAVSGNACIRWTLQEHVKVDVEEIRIEDARLARSYPGSLWRLSWVSEADYTHRFGLIISPRTEDC